MKPAAPEAPAKGKTPENDVVVDTNPSQDVEMNFSIRTDARVDAGNARKAENYRAHISHGEFLNSSGNKAVSSGMSENIQLCHTFERVFGLNA